jgi:hypothetical protein
MKVALVCIAKNEDHYIDEWVDYHLALGFDQIFVYENDWQCQNEKVVKITWPGEAVQKQAYNHFIQNHKEFDWVAFLDVDEFLVLKSHSNVKAFIKDYENHHSIAINWVLFGDSGLNFTGDYSVFNRFTKHQKGVNSHVKVIVNLHHDISMVSPHYTNRYAVDTNFNTVIGAYNPIGDNKIAQINHYFCKTREEFEQKRLRGMANYGFGRIRDKSDFDQHNFNEE